MRFIFKDLDRARRASVQIKKILADQAIDCSLTKCQQAVALATGYNSWSELADVCKQKLFSPSALDKDIGENLSLMRAGWQEMAFINVLKVNIEQAKSIRIQVNLTNSHQPNLINKIKKDYNLKVNAGITDKTSDQNLISDSDKQVNFVDVYLAEWEESERGWGVRPDGYSIHLSKDDYNKYVSDYWNRMPDEVQDEYERPANDYLLVFQLAADHILVQSLLKNHQRIYKHDPLYVQIKELLSLKQYQTFDLNQNLKIKR